MPKTTKKHFDLFKAECEKWVDTFSLRDWDVSYGIKKMPDDYAECKGNVFSRSATMWLAYELPEDELTTSEIKLTALHEVLELLLAKGRTLMVSKYVEDYEADEATHAVIQTLINYIKSRK